jgi:hypothetical protein
MTAFGKFGLLPEVAWGVDGNVIFVNTVKTFPAWIRVHSDSAANPAAAANDVPATLNPTPPPATIPHARRTEADAHYFKSWHWFYRWQMAGRTIPAFQTAMWYMSRRRIRDILDTRFRVVAINAVGVNCVVDARLGEIVTSVRGVAILHRWHIRKPNHVACNADPPPAAFGVAPDAPTPWLYRIIRETIRNSHLDWNLPPVDWTQQYESQLYTRILARANVVDPTHAHVDAWSGSGGLGTLSQTRGSFQLDTTGL